MTIHYVAAVLAAAGFCLFGVLYLHAGNAERGFALLFVGCWTPFLIASVGYQQHRADLAEAALKAVVQEDPEAAQRFLDRANDDTETEDP